MKKTLCLIPLILALIAFTQAYASNNIEVRIDGISAKKLYNAMNGAAIQNEGAAGHLYKRGKSVVCIYTNVPMGNGHGQDIPMQDPKHYVCKMQFDSNGLASVIPE